MTLTIGSLRATYMSITTIHLKQSRVVALLTILLAEIETRPGVGQNPGVLVLQ